MSEATPETKVEKPEFKVTPELLTDLRQNEGKIATLSKDQRDQVLEAIKAESEAAASLEVEAETPAADAPKPGEGEAQKTETEKPVEEKGYLRKRKLSAKEWEDRANTAQQRADAEEKRYQEFLRKRKEAQEAKVEPPNGDLYSEENIRSIFETNRKLLSKVEALEHYVEGSGKDATTRAQDEMLSTAEKATFAAMESLQEEFPGLATEKPISLLNKEYGEFMADIVKQSGFADNKDLTPQQISDLAWSKWTKDEAFRKQVKEAPEDLDKIQTLLRAENLYRSTGGNLKGHLLSIMHDTGVLPKMFERTAADASKDATARTLAAVGNKELKTIGPGDGTTKVTNGVITPEVAKRNLQLLLKKRESAGHWTEAEREESKRYTAILHGV